MTNSNQTSIMDVSNPLLSVSVRTLSVTAIFEHIARYEAALFCHCLMKENNVNEAFLHGRRYSVTQEGFSYKRKLSLIQILLILPEMLFILY